MQKLWMGLIHDRAVSRLMVMDGSRRTLLKARFLHRPLHPRAIPTLLEALALWHRRPVRAVLGAEEGSISFEPASWLDDLDICERTPLYEISVVPLPRLPPEPLPLQFDRAFPGEFKALRRMILEEVPA